MSLVRGAGGAPGDLLSQRPGEVVSMRDGELTIWLLAPTMLVTRVDGALTDVGAEAIVLGMLRVLSADRRVVVMHDWEAMLDYPSAAAARITAAAWSAGDALEGVHFLMPLRPGVFGVRAATAVLRRLTMHPTREAFDRRVHEEMLTRRAGRPSGLHAAVQTVPPASGTRPGGASGGGGGGGREPGP